MSSTLNTKARPEDSTYSRYLHDKLLLRRDDTKKVVEEVMPIILNIIREANRQDPRFTSDPIRIGSYWQGLKIKSADEFDLNIPLLGLGKYVWGTAEPAMYGFNRDIGDDQLETYPQDICVVSKNVPLPGPPAGYSRVTTHYVHPMWNRPDLEKLDFAGDIIPFLVRRHYRTLVQTAIRNLRLQGVVILCRRKHGPAVTVNIKLPVLQNVINVDLSPIIEPGNGINSSCGFPHPGSRWPSPDIQRQMQEAGSSRTAHHDFEWRWSFVAAEKLMLDGMDADGGCRKKVLRILKGLAQDVWATSSKPALTSYHLKNLLFWECERLPDSDSWRQDRLSERIHGIIQQLLAAIASRQLTLFMNKQVNLFSTADGPTLDMEAQRIRDFLQNPTATVDAKTRAVKRA